VPGDTSPGLTSPQLALTVGVQALLLERAAGSGSLPKVCARPPSGTGRATRTVDQQGRLVLLQATFALFILGRLPQTGPPTPA